MGLFENGDEALRLHGGPGFYVKAAIAPEATGLAALRCQSSREDVRPDEECEIDVFDFRYGLKHDLGMMGRAPAESQLSFPTDDLVSVQDRVLLLDQSGFMRDSWTALQPRARQKEEVPGAVETYLAAMYEGRTQFGTAETVGWFHEHGNPRQRLMEGVHDARTEWIGTQNAAVYGHSGESFEPFLVLIDLETEESIKVAVSGSVTSLSPAPGGDKIAFTEFIGDSQRKRLVVLDEKGNPIFSHSDWPPLSVELGWDKEMSRLRGFYRRADGGVDIYEVSLAGAVSTTKHGSQETIVWPTAPLHLRERYLVWREGCLYKKSLSDSRVEEDVMCANPAYEPFAWFPAATGLNEAKPTTAP
ncbi:MAG: hypothetical protein ACOCX1_04955 [Fimbriimonadaceae bacterium]